MARKYIGATLSLSEGNFFTNIRKAKDQSAALKDSLGGAVKTMKSQGGAAKNAGGGLASLAKKTMGAVAAYVSFSAASDGIKDCVDGVMELERANNRLSTLMLNTKGNTKEMVGGIIEYADKLELLTTVEGDATVAGASQLATFQLQGDSIKTLLPALQNLAVGQYGANVSQENMIQSANLLGKVMMGQTGALSKAGVSFTAAQEKILKTGTESQKTAALVDVLNQNFGGLAESVAQTDEGKVIQLRNAWGTVKDEIGMAVLPAVRGVVDYLASNIPNIRDTVTGAIEKVSPFIQGAFEKVKSGASTAAGAIGWVVKNFNWLAPVVTTVVAAIAAGNAVIAAHTLVTKIATIAQKGWNLAMTANPIGLVVMGIVALIAAGVALYKNWDKLKEKFPKLTGGIENLLNAMKTAFLSVWNLVKNAVQGIWEILQPVVEKLKPLFVGLWEGIKLSFQTAWENLKTILHNGIEYFTNLFRLWTSLFKGDWSGVWEAAKGMLSSAWNAITGVFSNVFNALDKLTGGKLSEIAGKIMNIFSKVKTFISDIWNGVIGIAKGGVNKIIGILNALINGANKLQFDIPDWVPGLGGKKFGLNIPTIPMLAQGGVIRQSGTVLVGESGPELLHLNRGAKVEPLQKPGFGNQNTFYITINAGTAEDGMEEMVRRIKRILETI